VAVREALDLARSDVVRLARNAFEIAWLTEQERAPYLDALDRYAAGAGSDHRP
jgi:adenosine deaminase